MKSNFVSSVSHELRAPIASVRLLAEGLERGRVQTEVKKAEYFRFIVQECRRLSSLIENVLDFSRIEQGRKQFQFEPTDLVALVSQTVQLMEPCAAERQIALTTQINNAQLSTINPPPSLDGRAIQQAIVNLLDNAIKHSPASQTVTVGLEVAEAFPNSTEASSPRITPHASRFMHHVSRCESDSSLLTRHSSLALWVEDHGEGIPPQEHARIFEQFYRRGSELRRQTQGVGLGLALVKHIVEAHGGRVHVRSVVGQGSRFTMELPLRTS
jgi:signal transduction histidine kinase